MVKIPPYIYVHSRKIYPHTVGSSITSPAHATIWYKLFGDLISSVKNNVYQRDVHPKNPQIYAHQVSGFFLYCTQSELKSEIVWGSL